MVDKKQNLKKIFSMLIILCLSQTSFLAAGPRGGEIGETRISKVSLDQGLVTLENGSEVVLSGIEINELGLDFLNHLSQSLIVYRVEYEDDSSESSSNEAYLFVKSQEMDFRNSDQYEDVFILNQFLVEQGMATVDEGENFILKDVFTIAEKEAKEKGFGVWSYENIKKLELENGNEE